MKKIFKRKSSPVPQQVEPDIAVQINKMQQQLVSLENKIDTLINRSSERPFQGRHFSKPFQRFDRSDRYGKGRQDNGPGERIFTQVICADCKKECEVPFKPSADRPVYCKDCFSKRKDTSSFRERYDNRPKEVDSAQGRSFNKIRGGENRKFGKKKNPIFLRRKERT